MISSLSYIKSDLIRYVGSDRLSVLTFAKQYFLNRGFKYQFWLRLSSCDFILLSKFAGLIRNLLSSRYMIDIYSDTDIGYGLYLGHGMGVVIHPDVKIGNNVNLSQFSTIGSKNGSTPVIGDNVYIGPNSCVLGGITIGDNVIIGAGCVVVKSVPDNAIVVGVPGEIIGYTKYNEYVNNRFLL